MNNFLILGNGGGGTSLMRGLLNAHSRIVCAFEVKGSNVAGDVKGTLKAWDVLAQINNGNLWGNKMPIEQFKTRAWSTDQVVSLSDKYKIIWIVRRFSMYHKKGFATEDVYRENWNWAQELYWAMRERHPETVIRVSFEDLLLRPVIELKRLCVFLGIRYEATMLNGTKDTGLGKYDQPTINKGRI